MNFDRRVKFWFILESKSVDFTGVLGDFGVINRCVFMDCFFIKYNVFGLVRWNALFSRVWVDFWWNSGDFLWCEKLWNAWFCWVCSKSVSKWFGWFWGVFEKIWFFELRCGWNRWGDLRCRGFVLKCKLPPHYTAYY